MKPLPARRLRLPLPYLTLPLCAWLAAAAGCDRSHLGPRYGVALRMAFARQVIDPHAGAARRGADGLDPQEAAIIAESYRRSLSPRGDADAARRAPMMMLPPPVQPPPPPAQ